MEDINPQKLLEKQYKQQLRRIKRRIKEYEKKGFKFPKPIIPKEPKKITDKSVEQLKRITPKVIRAKSVLPEGELKPKTNKPKPISTKSKTKRPKTTPAKRKTSSKLKGKKVSKSKSKEEKEQWHPRFDKYEEITSRLSNEFFIRGSGFIIGYKSNRRFMFYDTEEDKSALINIWRDTIDTCTQNEELDMALYNYISEKEAELSEYLSGIQYASTQEDYYNAHQRLAELLAATPVTSRSLTEQEVKNLGEEIDTQETGEADYYES